MSFGAGIGRMRYETMAAMVTTVEKSLIISYSVYLDQ